ncbi:uncharacterized protein LOC129567354 [Sitodiplosis mosellana]|uniref:uncharacterized protein LOC129567354 n=1 Tax=Sitodiplosis mosellana TaxID=263140 RepID=UPI002444DC81|nr:uncharacterized protein LOC129567354 [Sitodiplosis mosellana]
MDVEREATRCGKFGYDTFNGQHIPYIFRNKDAYFATHFLWWHYKDQKVKLGSKPKDFRYLKKYEMYDEEADLMNGINSWHNDSKYKYTFDRNDTLVKLNDVRDIFKYQQDCGQKLEFGAQYRMINGGIVRIQFDLLDKSKSDIVLPYVQNGADRYVPVEVVFAENAVPQTLIVTKITGIDVMYMRFLVDVLKIDLSRKKFKIPCVNLDGLVEHLQKCAGGYSEYDENYWPSKENTPNHKINLALFASICKNSNLEEAKGSVKQKTTHGTSVDEKSSEKAEPKVASRKHKLDEPQQPKKDNKEPRQTNKKPKMEDAFYDVDEILDYTKQSDGIEMVLIRWKGYSSADDSWEPLSSLNETLKREVKEKWTSKVSYIRK